MDKSGRTLTLTLTQGHLSRKFLIINQWRYGDSNPRPSHCERDALPTELYPLLGESTEITMLQRTSAARLKAHARNSECSRPLQLESSLNENSACLEMEKTSFQPASVLPDCRPAHLPQDCSPVPSLPWVPQVLRRCSSWVRTVVRRAKGPAPPAEQHEADGL
jgi:hypothetical protein